MNIENCNGQKKVSEIGSEFWIEDIDINYNSDLIKSKDNVLDKFKNAFYTSSGRGALTLLLRHIEVKNKKVLVPSYICESIIYVFEREGYELIYYNLDEKLRPINLDIMIDLNIGIFFHMGYFGYFTNEVVTEYISILRNKSVIIIEDITHTFLSMPQKKIENDFEIGSIRKWFGIPTGGFLLSQNNIDIENLFEDKKFMKTRLNGLMAKSEYMKIGDVKLKNKFLKYFAVSENILNFDSSPYNIDKLSKKIIENFNYNELIQKRRDNFEFLILNIKNIEGINLIFQELDDNITPMFVPIYVLSERNKVRNKLIENEIYCPIHWPISKRLNGHINNATQKIYDRILSIPCDQRYNIDDMQRIVNAIKDVMQ